MKIKLFMLCWRILLFSLMATTLHANTLNVPSEWYQPAQQKALSANALKLPLHTRQKRTQVNNRPSSFTLTAPRDAELASLLNQDTRRKAFQVGIRRELPELPAVSDWVWSDVAGGRAGQFVINSEQATRIRILLQTEVPLPVGAEIRIYDPVANASVVPVFGPYTEQDFIRQGQSATFWTPTIAGEQLGIELFLPEGIDPATLQLSIPLVSHVAYDMQTRQFKTGKLKAFASCDVSIACVAQEWQETAKSVARYIYTGTDGSTYLCSGTLINDLDDTTQIPYFLTAAHCIADSNSAASMDFFWLDRESSCGADDANPIQVSGGATLLHSEPNLDSTLVQINNSPPAGTLMSGWSLEPFRNPDDVVGIHHALGNPKQFAAGNFSTYTRISSTTGGYTIYPDPLGDFFQVYWTQGITSPGSSGSGLWASVNGQRLLKGNLVGGSSSCSAPDAADDYARLERFYPYISDWLGSVYTPLSGLLDNNTGLKALTDGVLLGRYLAGVRGSALLTGLTVASIDIAALEARLAEVTAKIDLDQDGATTRDKDALLLTRYLLGLRADSLIEDIDLSQSGNNTSGLISAAIEAFLLGE